MCMMTSHMHILLTCLLLLLLLLCQDEGSATDTWGDNVVWSRGVVT